MELLKEITLEIQLCYDIAFHIYYIANNYFLGLNFYDRKNYTENILQYHFQTSNFAAHFYSFYNRINYKIYYLERGWGSNFLVIFLSQQT